MSDTLPKQQKKTQRHLVCAGSPHVRCVGRLLNDRETFTGPISVFTPFKIDGAGLCALACSLLVDSFVIPRAVHLNTIDPKPDTSSPNPLLSSQL